jgi:hypothetical protein
MKNPRPILIWCLLCVMLALAGPSLSAAATAPTDEGVPLLIDIRAEVDQGWKGLSKRGPVAHGKVYALVSVKETKTEEPLLKSLDEHELLRLVRAELAANGFREIAAGEKPDVVLTITYGRGFLHNPHVERGTVTDELNSEGPTANINSARQAFKQREPGFEAKRQRAQAEKLSITVSAWKLPAARGEKPHLYWRTSMVTDNPAGRDLNLAMPALLKAGAKYFDRETKEGEVTINTTMPTGTVKLGPLNVIEEAKPGK